MTPEDKARIEAERWISVEERLPEQGVLVDCMLGSRIVIEPLKRRGRLWFVADDSMYVYYTPTHWKPSQK